MKWIFAFLAGMFLCFYVSAFAEKDAVGNIAVIVNSDSPIFSIKETPEADDIKNIYLGKVKYWNGSVIKALNNKDKSILDRFLKNICNMSIGGYQGYWVRYSLESGSDIPKAVDNSKDIISFVQKEKNAIGYVPESETKDIEKIKIIKIIKNKMR